MKRFYLFLLTAIMALCGTFAAKAATGGTISWNIPGAVDIYTWTNNELVPVELAADATEYNVTVNMKSHYVYIKKEGYLAASFEGVRSNGQTQSIALASPYGYEGDLKGKLYEVRFTGANAGTNFTLTLISEEEANKEATFTLDIENGDDLINGITIGSRTLTGYKIGKQTVTYKPNLEKGVKIIPANNKKIFSVKHNGVEVSLGGYAWSPEYAIAEIQPNDVITIRGYETDPVDETCKVTLETTGAAAELVRNLWDNTGLKALVAEADGSYTVTKGHKIRINFNSDYEDFENIVITANEAAIEISDASSAPITVEADTKITVSATKKVYGEATWTLYVANPEGVYVGIGAGSAGGSIDLTAGGEKVDTPVEFKAAYESGALISPAMTVPADNLYKFTVKVSEKYPTLMVTPKEGYYIIATRQSNLSSVADNPISSKTFYVYAKKIERTAKMAVYFEKRTSNLISFIRSANNEINIRPEAGYTVINFDPEYDNPFTAGFISNSEITPTVLVDGEKASADDNGVYAVTAADGTVVKLFEDLGVRKPKTITVNKAEGAAAEIVYDKVKKHTATEPTSTFSAYSKSEIAITPDENTIVKVDDEDVTPEAGESYTFNTTGDHTIELAAKPSVLEQYTLEPENGSTVESLDKITVSFPTATSLAVAMAGDEIMFRSADNNYAPISMEIKAVEGASYPTFEIIPTPAPSAAKGYMLYIPEGMFAGASGTSPEIQAQFTLKKEVTEVNVDFSPTGDIQIGEYHTALNFIFDESFVVTEAADFADKVTVKFDDEVLPADAYMHMAEGCSLMFMLDGNAYLKPGKITISLAPGAIELSGTPLPTAVEHTWTYIAAKEYTMTLSPAPGTVPSLEEITITFDGADNVTIERATGISLRKNKDISWGVTPATITPIEGAEKPSFLVTFSKEPTTAGDYVLTIGYGTFALDGTVGYPEDNTDFTYTIDPKTGIEGVIVDGEATGDIYNLQGIRLNVKWAELPAGIYIVNGHKVAKH